MIVMTNGDDDDDDAENDNHDPIIVLKASSTLLLEAYAEAENSFRSSKITYYTKVNYKFSWVIVLIFVSHEFDWVLYIGCSFVTMFTVSQN